jgi:hypothetical protein
MTAVPEMRRVHTPAKRKRREKGNATGLKCWYVPGSETVLTPYATRELARRRAAARIAKQSRKVNRA